MFCRKLVAKVSAKVGLDSFEYASWSRTDNGIGLLKDLFK